MVRVHIISKRTQAPQFIWSHPQLVCTGWTSQQLCLHQWQLIPAFQLPRLEPGWDSQNNLDLTLRCRATLVGEELGLTLAPVPPEPHSGANLPNQLHKTISGWSNLCRADVVAESVANRYNIPTCGQGVEPSQCQCRWQAFDICFPISLCVDI